MKKISSARSLVLIALAVLTGCRSTTRSAEDYEKFLADPQAPRVLVEICLPDKRAFFDELRVDVTDLPVNLAPQELSRLFQNAKEKKGGNPLPKSTVAPRQYEVIRQWKRSDSDISKSWIPFRYVHSMGASGDVAYLVDSTESNQAVFANYTNERPGDLVAVDVSLMAIVDGREERRTYWFKPPRQRSQTREAPWLDPISEEGPTQASVPQKTWWLLTHGKEMPIYPVGLNAPRVRYRLLSKDEYWRLDREGRRARTTIQLQRTVDGLPTTSDDFRSLPAKREVIPSC